MVRDRGVAILDTKGAARTVGDGDRDRWGVGSIAGAIARPRGQRVRSVGGRRRVPGDRVRRAVALGAERPAVDEEFEPCDRQIVRPVRRDGDGSNTVAPPLGEVTVTAGGVVSVLETVTVTPAEVVVFPAASRACAVTVCDPLAAVEVFQAISYGAVVSSAPTCAPSTKSFTPITPMLSDALAVTVIVAETVAPPAGDVTLTVGAVVSAGGPPPCDVTSSASTIT